MSQSVQLMRAVWSGSIMVAFGALLAPMSGQATGGSIAGALLTEAGDPLASVEVQFLELDLTTTTDADGAFRFDGIPVGQHDVTIRTPGYESPTLKVGILFAGYLRDLGQITMAAAETLAVASTSKTVDESDLERSNNANVLLRGDIAASDATTLDQLIGRLRPRWLRVRGQVTDVGGSREQIRVYVDNSPRGGIETLQTLSTLEIQRIQWVPPRDSRTRYGTGHGAGVIEVYTRRN